MRKYILWILVCAIAITTLPPRSIVAIASGTVKSDYAYFLNSAADSASVDFGAEITEHGISLKDGQKLGISDQSHPYYNETEVLDGVTGRHQYAANSMYLTVDKSHYEDTDREFLVSIVFYDFGPGEGAFYFEYHTTSGETKRVTIIKPGTNPGWAVETVVIDDMDLSKAYDDGSQVRLVNRAFNTFKKVEIVNVSKAKREKKSVDITCLNSGVRKELSSMYVISKNDTRFANKNLSNTVTGSDIAAMIKTIGTSAPSATLNAEGKVSQGELIRLFMSAVGIAKRDDEDYVSAALRTGIINKNAYFVCDEANATYYNLINITYTALLYEKADGSSFLKTLIEKGFYENKETGSITNAAFNSIYYMMPRKIPYKIITDPQTKRTYRFMSIDSGLTIRPYLGHHGWLPDNSGFVCGKQDGNFYYYNVETQMLVWLDQAEENREELQAYANVDGYIYYRKLTDGIKSLWRVEPKTQKRELLYTAEEGMDIVVRVTNDGRYVLYTKGPINRCDDPEGKITFGVIDLQTGKSISEQQYQFPISNWITHLLIHPIDPNIVEFSHETDTRYYDWTQIRDRSNIMDMTTGEVITFNQGVQPDGRSVQGITHQNWSEDGEYLYFCAEIPWGTSESGEAPAFIRINKDGTHRQYFKSNMPVDVINHGTASGDNKWAAVDKQYLSLLNLETHQIFPIVDIRGVILTQGHPFHPHPEITSNYIISWGHKHDGALGVAWMDFNYIAKNEAAKGGRYAFGDDVTRISYENLECESSEVKKAGINTVKTKPGKAIFLDINPEIVDTDNEAVKITFDYYDNSRAPIVLHYTKGVEDVNDCWRVYNKKKRIQRNATNKWKTAEIIIESGNFENIGKFESDIKIVGEGLNTYIANVKVERLDK